MEKVEITIIGAGVIGLAIAAVLSDKFKNIVILEQQNTFGQGISSRNSEVIHSGIYYPAKSFKAKLCVKGAERLYEICEQYSIPHKRIGKLIIATNQSETSSLEKFFENGKKNNVKDLILLDKKEVEKIESNTNAVTAIYSPNTGIVDTHSLMKHFLRVSESQGVIISYNSEVLSLEKQRDHFDIGIKPENYHFKSRIVINCAGLSSDSIAALAGIDIHKCGYKLNLCKGSYFSYSKSSPINTLVYPVPQKELVGLGIHATLDLGNRLRFGPDVEYIETPDYSVDINKKNSFYESAIKIIRHLEKDAFIPDMVGIRPKLQSNNGEASDFIIREESDKGLDGLINLIGIESPGLTASTAIAEMVKNMVSKSVNRDKL